MELQLQESPSAEPPIVQVFRLTTRSYWSAASGINVVKTLKRLKKKSSGFEWIEEDISQCGCDEVTGQIENLFEAADGIYRLVPVNKFIDPETGNLEDYNWRLVSHFS